MISFTVVCFSFLFDSFVPLFLSFSAFLSSFLALALFFSVLFSPFSSCFLFSFCFLFLVFLSPPRMGLAASFHRSEVGKASLLVGVGFPLIFIGGSLVGAQWSFPSNPLVRPVGLCCKSSGTKNFFGHPLPELPYPRHHTISHTHISPSYVLFVTNLLHVPPHPPATMPHASQPRPTSFRPLPFGLKCHFWTSLE